MILDFSVLEYTGPKLSLLFTGCGASISGLLLVPGVSKVLYDIQIPYAHEAVERLTGPLACPSVSKERVLALHARYRPEDIAKVTVTAAITSTTYRRGDTHAYIAVEHPYVDTKVWHLILPKMNEKMHDVKSAVLAAREFEDFTICNVALMLATKGNVLCIDEQLANDKVQIVRA